MCIHRNDLDIVHLRQNYTEIPFGSEHVISLLSEPRPPGFSKTAIEHGLSFSLIIINIDRIGLMVSHCCNHSNICMLPQFFTNHCGKVEIVTLTLLPNIVRSVVSGPNDKVQIHFLQLFEEKLEGLHGKVAIIKRSPIPRLCCFVRS